MHPLVKRIARRTGWVVLQALLIAIILGTIAAMWIPRIMKWMK